MKNVRQLSRQNSNSASSDEETKDKLDAKYINFKNKSDRESQKSTESETEHNTVGDFINPVFRPAEDDKNIYDSPKANYDSLSFSKNTENNRQPSPTTRKSKTRTDITKPPEEFEMGVSNHGYHNEHPRPESWNKSLSFSPYAIDTPISGPTDIRGSSLSIPEKRNSGSSKHSEYSFVSADSENPYAAPSEKISAYDTIPGQKLVQQGRLPPPRQGTKKTNLAYESAVIKHTQVHRETVKSDNPKEGFEEDEHSKCCHTIFIVLVGIIALIALVIVFLIVFGTISVKKCKECDVVEGPQTSKQTGGNGGSTDALILEIQNLRKNLTALHHAFAKIPKSEDQSAKINVLENELAGQKLQVTSLTNELAKQKDIAIKLNETTKTLRTRIAQNKLKMVELNTTQLTRHVYIARFLKKIRSELTQNLTKTGKSIADIQVNLTKDLNEMEKAMREDLNKKISTSNFTKLITDAQGVVDELYRMINTSNDKQHKLNETVHTLTSNIYNTLSDRLEVLSNSSTILEQNVTLYRERYSKMKNMSLSGCKFDRYSRWKPISSGHSHAKQTVTANPTNSRVISATCDVTANKVILSEDKSTGAFTCECTGIEMSSTPIKDGIRCTIHYLHCPI